MIERFRNLLPVAAPVLATTCAMQPSDFNLVRSFADQIAAVDGVTDFEHTRDRNVLAFTGPDGRGGTALWQVRIQAVELISAGERPIEGHVFSFWLRDAQLIEPTGPTWILPEQFFDRIVAQRCYALWDEASNRWDWPEPAASAEAPSPTTREPDAGGTSVRSISPLFPPPQPPASDGTRTRSAFGRTTADSEGPPCTTSPST